MDFGTLALPPARQDECRVGNLRLLELAWAVQTHVRNGGNPIETKQLWPLIAQYSYMGNTTRGRAAIGEGERDDIFRVAYRQVLRMKT
jgi:hypothetical protein